MHSILFCSIFYTSSCRQHHTASHQYSSVFDFVSEIYSIKILIIDLTEFFCHSCIQCFFPWQTKTEHTHRLSLFLCIAISFFLSLIFLSRFHCFSGIKNVWIIQLRASSVKIACLLWRWWRYKMGQDRLWSLSLESQGLIDRSYPRDLHATWTDTSRDIVCFFSIPDKSPSRVCLSHHTFWEVIIKMHICMCHLMHRLIVHIANESFEIHCMKICCI